MTNAETNRRILTQAWGKGDVELLDELTAPGYRFNDPTLPEPLDVQGEQELIRAFRAAVPDLSFRIEDEAETGDVVAQRWVVTGTQEGELWGIPATGRSFELHGNSFVRFSGGKLAEVHTTWDALGMLRQLGVLPEPAVA
jgi:steroid delta-isomerase-like uncharacterized protein